MRKKLETFYSKNVSKLNIKVLAITLALLILAGFSYFAPERSEQVKLTSSYPATVCPAIGNKVSSIAALTQSKVNRRSIDGISKRLNPGKSSVIALNNTDGEYLRCTITFAYDKYVVEGPLSSTASALRAAIPNGLI